MLRLCVVASSRLIVFDVRQTTATTLHQLDSANDASSHCITKCTFHQSHSPQGNGPPVSRPRCKSAALSSTQSAERSTDAASRPLTLELAPYRRPRDRLPGPCSAHPVDARGNHQLFYLCTRKRRSRFSPGILLFSGQISSLTRASKGSMRPPEIIIILQLFGTSCSSRWGRLRSEGLVNPASIPSLDPGLPASRQNTLFPTPVLRT